MTEYNRKVKEAEERAEQKRQELIRQRDEEIARKRAEMKRQIEEEYERRKAEAERQRKAEIEARMLRKSSVDIRILNLSEQMLKFSSPLQMLKMISGKRSSVLCKLSVSLPETTLLRISLILTNI